MPNDITPGPYNTLKSNINLKRSISCMYSYILKWKRIGTSKRNLETLFVNKEIIGPGPGSYFAEKLKFKNRSSSCIIGNAIRNISFNLPCYSPGPAAYNGSCSQVKLKKSSSYR